MRQLETLLDGFITDLFKLRDMAALYPVVRVQHKPTLVFLRQVVFCVVLVQTTQARVPADRPPFVDRTFTWKCGFVKM